jgi:predicted MFS family arabinose efflux permease
MSTAAAPQRFDGAVDDGGRSLTRQAGMVLLLCFALNLIGRGFNDSFATFLLPLAREFPWSRARLTGVYAVSLLVFSCSAPFAGAMLDRYGHRTLYLVGLACLTSSLFIASAATELWHFYIATGLLGGTSVACLGMIPAAMLLRRWYARRLTSAVAVAWAGLGSGILLIAPLAQYLIDHAGWRFAYRTFGIVVALALLVVALLPWARIVRGPHAAPHASPSADRLRADLAAAMRHRAFWGLCTVFGCTSIAMTMITIEIVAYLTAHGVPAMQAASSYGVIGGLSVTGMVGSGWLAGRIGFRATAVSTFAMTLTGIALLAAVAHTHSTLVMLGFVLLFGISQGTRGPIVATLTTRLFAGPASGSVYGMVTATSGLGGAVGAWLSGALFDHTGSYTASFVAAALCLLIAATPFVTLHEFHTR